ncbi:hypothetical protein BDV98DRAFT_594886 [Pterulicium gracile]|uniref:Uncharacterized protein n=1 Tax=Pterulicium gracile TaxID=1884261 RepID=A0A5C3QDE7_9AGAR|nr:hypothetical protein BDV98DRAFT_594886 [Pterula gracilis]
MRVSPLFTTLSLVVTSVYVYATTTILPSVASELTHATAETAAKVLSSPSIVAAIVAAHFGSRAYVEEVALRQSQWDAAHSKVQDALRMPDPCWFSGTVCDIDFHTCCFGQCMNLKPGEAWGGISALYLGAGVCSSDWHL